MTELEMISNKITDRTLAGASAEELKSLVEESMEIMDRAKLDKLP